jgi:hypothetical protein
MSTQFQSDLPSRAALKGAATGAAIGFAVWLFSHGSGSLHIGPLQFSGDWVQSLALPLPSWLLSMGAGGVVGAIIGAVALVRSRRRAALMVETAAKMGLKYARHTSAADVLVASDLGKLFVSDSCDSVEVEHLFRGVHDGLPLELFDLSVVSRSSKGRRTIVRRTVCVVPADGPPDFALSPRRMYDSLLSYLGFSTRMRFACDQVASPLDREVVRKFAAAWSLEAVDWATASKTDPINSAQLEQRVRGYFTAGLMNSLRSFQGWSVAARGGWLIVWRGSGFSSAEDRKQLAGAASKLRDVFLGPCKSPGDVGVPAMPGDTEEKRLHRAAGSLAGGLLGGVPGFFGGVFLSDPLDSVGSHLFFFVGPLVGLALGALAGAVVGSCLGGRFFEFKPRQVTATSHEPSGWVVAGLFLGFMLGGMVGGVFFMLVATSVGVGQVPAWLVFPVFFTFPIAGLIGGVIAGGRIQDYRARRRGGSRTAQSGERIGTTRSQKPSPVAAERQVDTAQSGRCE